MLTCPAFIGWVDVENAEKGYFYTKTNHIINTAESTHQSMNKKTPYQRIKLGLVTYLPISVKIKLVYLSDLISK